VPISVVWRYQLYGDISCADISCANSSWADISSCDISWADLSCTRTFVFVKQFDFDLSNFILTQIQNYM